MHCAHPNNSERNWQDLPACSAIKPMTMLFFVFSIGDEAKLERTVMMKMTEGFLVARQLERSMLHRVKCIVLFAPHNSQPVFSVPKPPCRTDSFIDYLRRRLSTALPAERLHCADPRELGEAPMLSVSRSILAMHRLLHTGPHDTVTKHNTHTHFQLFIAIS